MNEYLSEEMPYNNIPHDYNLAVKICKGFRSKISEDIPKLLTDLIKKSWDANAKDRPTAEELCQMLNKLNSEISTQIKECKKIRENKLKNSFNENKLKIIQNPQAICTSRLLNFKNLPELVNSSDLSFYSLLL